RGIVIKSHGGANSDSFFQAIKEAYLEAHAKIIEKITAQVSLELENQKRYS
ncbi:MAG: phosphate acyltransferase, partial [Candidatus Thioglobus sp.]